MAIGDGGRPPEDIPIPQADLDRLTWTGTGISATWNVPIDSITGATIRGGYGTGGFIGPVGPVGPVGLTGPVGACGCGSCSETHSIPNTPPAYEKVEEEYRLSCRNEQAIYDLLEHYEAKGLRVYEVHGPAWLARVVRGMKDFKEHRHQTALIGWIYGVAIRLDHKREDKVRVIAWPPENASCACLP